MADFCQTFILKRLTNPMLGADGEEREREKERDPTKGTHKKNKHYEHAGCFRFRLNDDNL